MSWRDWTDADVARVQERLEELVRDRMRAGRRAVAAYDAARGSDLAAAPPPDPS